MKTFRLIIILCLFSTIANSQDCFWAKKAGTNQNEEGINISTDINGNVYVVGKYSANTLSFGTVNLTGSYDFIAKYSAGGVFKWAKDLPGEAKGIVCDNTGFIYITGSYGGTKYFGATELIALGGSDAFTAKLDSLGNFIWATSFGGNNGDYPKSITVDSIGNVYSTGEFYSDTLWAGGLTLLHDSGTVADYFIAQYDAMNGNIGWAKVAGGNRYTNGYGVTTDTNNDVYVTGSFNNDSVKFDNTTLYTNASGADNIFITKYNAAGSLLWAKSYSSYWGSSIAYDLKADLNNNIYINGEFQGVSLKIGNDSLINHSQGSTDIFIAKFDSNGNPIWARCGGGSNYDYSRKLTLDDNFNVYAIGWNTSSTCYFETDSILSSSTDIFIVKYNTNGQLQLLKGIGGASADFGRAIAAGTSGDVYFTGTFFSTTFQLANTILNNSGAYDFFVADIFSFNSSITSSTNVSCNGANDGAINTSASDGHLPYTYSWNTNPIQNTANATNLPAGVYTVTITEAYGCSQTSSVTITEPAADAAAICLVTVDNESQHNIIMWDKTSFTTVDSFIVYREVATNNYQPIAAVAFDSLSMFVDTVRTLYFPNTGNPNAGTYRYKIQAKSTCGSFGPMSPYHNTIYILNSSGNFYWTQPYTIEGGINPVSSYVLMRDDNSNGNWQAVASVAGTQQIVNDPLYSIFQNTASWKVVAQFSVTCDPTRSINTSQSNIYSNNPTVSIKENALTNSMSIFPNPSSGPTSISYTLKKNSKVIIDIYNTLGQKIEVIENNEQQIGEYKYNFNFKEKGLQNGVYFVKFTVDDKSLMQIILLTQ